MNCRDVEARLEALLDDQLPVDERARIEAHLAGCAECDAVYQRLLALRAVLKAAQAPRRAPDVLRANILKEVRRGAAGASLPVEVSRRPAHRAAWLLAAAAVLALSMVGSWRVATHRAEGAEIAEEILGSHVRSLLGTHLTDVATSDQHTVKPWFNGKLDYSPTVDDFAGKGFPLVGGRLEYIGGRAVAALVYGRRQHVINLFVWPTDHGPVAGARTLSRQGYHLQHWNENGNAYWVASDLGEAELQDFVALVRESGRVK